MERTQLDLTKGRVRTAGKETSDGYTLALTKGSHAKYLKVMAQNKFGLGILVRQNPLPLKVICCGEGPIPPRFSLFGAGVNYAAGIGTNQAIWSGWGERPAIWGCLVPRLL
ncbi:hypothetical protein AAHE18_20G158200 [Arachis hypogaea]